MNGRIPHSFIDDLIARADIVEVIGKRVTLTKAGRDYKAPCPFHDEKTPSFTVSAQKGFYHCFGCGAHGTAIGFLMNYESLGFVDAVEALAEMLGVEVPREAQAARRDEAGTNLYKLLAEADQIYRAALKGSSKAIDYLKNRGIAGRTAAQFAMGLRSRRLGYRAPCAGHGRGAAPATHRRRSCDEKRPGPGIRQVPRPDHVSDPGPSWTRHRIRRPPA